MKKSILTLLFFATITMLLSSCATTQPNYFPLKNETCIQELKAPKMVIIMPFEVDTFIYINMINTMEKLQAKTKAARAYVYEAFKDALEKRNYSVAKYVSLDEIMEPNFNQETLTIIQETNDEFHSARHAFLKNLDNEKGKGFNYSIGKRAQDLAEAMGQSQCLILFINPSGRIACLDAVNSPLATTMAILSLGTSLLTQTSEDSISLSAALVDSQNGNIIWYNHEFLYGKNLLLESNIKETADSLLQSLPNG